MGFWHTGYFEHHEDAGLGDWEPEPLTYKCQLCDASYLDKKELIAHRFQEHPIRMPILLIRGMELGDTPLKISRALKSTEIHIDRCTSARLNRESVEVESIPSILSGICTDRVMLALSNGAESKVFTIDFEIANNDDLNAVDVAFDAMARRKILTRAAIDSFIGDCKYYRSASRYVNGICEYLYAILSKESSPDSSLPHSNYPERFNRAADSLRDFDRQLARTIRALIAFDLNHFADAASAAPSGLVKDVSKRFATALFSYDWTFSQAVESQQLSKYENLLIDHDANQIVRWASMPAITLMGEADKLTEQISHVKQNTDKLKLKMILAQCHIAGGRRDHAIQILKRLRGYELTRNMVEAYIGRMKGIEA